VSFICPFLFVTIFTGQAWADGKGKLATSSHCADSGGETVKNVRRHSLDRLHASMNKQKKKLATEVAIGVATGVATKGVTCGVATATRL
jgi:hypothetical protein